MRLHLLLAPLAVLPVAAAPVFIGSGGENIFIADFDPGSGRLSEVHAAAEYRNPNFLALHPSLPLLYAVGQPREPSANGTGAVAVFRIDDGRGLAFLGETTSGGRGPCHVALDRAGKAVAVANYGDGRIALIRLAGDGSFAGEASVVENSGSGPHPRRQEGPHAHGVYFDKANAHLFVPDLGLDKVLVYRFGEGKLQAAEPLATAPGAGPRHLAFSPDERHAYVINELDNTILVAAHDAGKLQPVETVPTLPEDYDGQNTTAEIEVHPGGRFVYGSNRGHDSIVVYERDPNSGKLTLVHHRPCAGKTPRHFAIDPSGKWLLCGHQASNTLAVHPIDPETGALGDPVSVVDVPAPISFVFPR